MKSEWSEFFGYVCSEYSGEIVKLLEHTEYKALSEEFKNTKNPEIADKKAACYYEQAALVAFKHFINLLQETNIFN